MGMETATMADFLREQVNQGITRDQLEQGVSPGFDAIFSPPELPSGIIEAAIANGQVASNGYIVVEDELFADEANVGSSGVFLDIIGNVRVLGVAPGTSDRDVASAVTDFIELVNPTLVDDDPTSGAFASDPNDINRAFAEFQNGLTTPLEIVEEGGLPNPADLASETVQVDGARIDAVITFDNENLLFQTNIDVPDEEAGAALARQLVDERGVLTPNGFIVVDDDQITVQAPNGAVIEGGVIIDTVNKVIIKGSGDEAAFGRDAELLEPAIPLEGIEEAAVAINQFDNGDFVDVEIVG